MRTPVTIYNLGLVEFQAAYQIQNWLAGEIAASQHPPALLLLEHPHTYTFGRQGSQANLLWDQKELNRKGITVHWTDRGGDVTYHGPGQLVGYPILPLVDDPHSSTPHILAYLRKLEALLINTLKAFSITGTRIPGQTGVWVQSPDHPPAKIASIGVRLDVQSITRHGFALNINPEMAYWQGIIACGLENQRQTSFAQLLPTLPQKENILKTISQAFSNTFDLSEETADLQAISHLLARFV